MIKEIQFSKEEYDDVVSVIRKIETPNRMTVKVNRNVNGLILTMNGTEQDFNEYISLLEDNGIIVN